MAGRGPAPKKGRRRANVPERGEWKPAAGIGWQHGELPEAPDGLRQASLEAWAIWLRSWFAAHWVPEDLPGLRQVIRLYDQVERGEFQRASELRLQMDTYGITPKGQQDRRWRPPKDEPASGEASASGARGAQAAPYGHLRAVD